MRRSILATLCVSLLAALPAAAQQPRPSISTIDAAQKRMNAAICAKADADGDTYRPFSCEPRCDCFGPQLVTGAVVPATCEEISPGVFDLGFNVPGTCSGGSCEGVGGNACDPQNPACPAGQECQTRPNCTPFPPLGITCDFCSMPCASDEVCPNLPAPLVARLLNVSPPDSPNVVVCVTDTDGNPFNDTPVNINSNDALECLEQVEAVTGPCQ
jgi:hypothetical protein